MASRLSAWNLIRRVSARGSRPILSSSPLRFPLLLEASDPGGYGVTPSVSRVFFFSSSRPSQLGEVQGPAAIDYQSLLPEDEFHRMADDTIHDLQEKFEEYGDSIELDGLDIDYGNQVLTLKLGSFGTYVVNKQTPNRQIWLSSPVSGPARFDWDATTKAWVYRRTGANLLQLLEDELQHLCGKPIHLSR